MKDKFDLIIFDWDGTLINSIDWITHCLQVAGETLGFKKPEAQTAKDVIGLCIDNAVAALYPTAEKQTQRQIVQLYRQTYHSKQLSQKDFFPGVYEMLLDLKDAGYLLAVATGKTRFALLEALVATETESLFNITRCADETASKPNPLMLHEIMAKTKTAPERSLMVGDSTHDLQMAQNANVAAIGVTCGANSKESLEQFNPLLCLQQPAELLNYMT